MSNFFMGVDEVATELEVSKSFAYKIMRELNVELKKKGYLTVSGKVSRKYFLEKLCYGESKNQKE
ncbi:DNA-binding protein [Ruminococcaceae bacterium BL-4]|jgi:predicted transcriptional regulator|nr:DNA-binding protein [Ruminococcaceae bacterium BL-4]